MEKACRVPRTSRVAWGQVETHRLRESTGAALGSSHDGGRWGECSHLLRWVSQPPGTSAVLKRPEDQKKRQSGIGGFRCRDVQPEAEALSADVHRSPQQTPAQDAQDQKGGGVALEASKDPGTHLGPLSPPP